MEHVAHWNEAEGRRREIGHLGATWTDLGSAAGSVTVGVHRIQLDPGKWATPAHAEGIEEEIFYVLAGSGLSWQEGKTYEVSPGDCLVHLALAGTHTLNAGPDGLDVLAFGMRAHVTGTRLPRAGVAWFGSTWVEIGAGGTPWEREAALGAPELPEPSERPATIVALDRVERRAWGRGERVESTRRDLGRAAGSERTGLRHVEVAPGKLSAPAHCHSAEEELFVVLDGDGAVLLGMDEEPVRPGTIVSRPAGTCVAHAFRAGDGGLALLAYGTRDPSDVTYYPRSNKVYLRGVGVIGRIENLDYWDGEE